jgi:glucose-1-phosphate thymidylyltransferase
MKGVILCGGAGTRLDPLTKVTNKHLLPVFNKPMIYYPLQTLIDAGIKDILIVTGGESIGDFLRLLGSGREWGARFTYRCQDGSGGIPVALNLAKEFVDNDKFVCILGDNIMENSIKSDAEEFAKSKSGAKIFLQKVNDPKRYGVAEVKDNKVIGCFEKPENPTTDLAILGVYMFDSKVFDIIPDLKPSKRRELEIVDVLNHYIKKDNLTYSVLKGFWIDAGTFEALHKANRFIADKRRL